DRLAALEPAAVGAGWNAERVSGLDVEAAGTRLLDEGVADRRDAVRDLERLESVLVPVERVARAELDQLQVVRQATEPAAEPAEQRAQARRAVPGEGGAASAQRERLQHPREPEEVVGVEVRQEPLAQVEQADRRAQQLALRPLAAVDEEPFPAAPQEQ